MTGRFAARGGRARELAVRSLSDPRARAQLARALRNRGVTLTQRARARLRSSGSSRIPELPPAPIPDGPVARPGLRVATILDAFSAMALEYEWDQHPVPRQGWRSQLEEQPPALLFVESAWSGNDRAWRLTMTGAGGPHRDLVELVDWCRAHAIPTIFWNKEDPPNYETFVATAALFDHVFTVDADMIERYTRDLGHDRVGLLPFAAQPRIHSPVRYGDPASTTLSGLSVAFAGTYFTGKHPERRRQMDFLLPAAQQRGLHIFSRLQAEDDRYQFPPRYQSCVVGSLPYPEMLAAARAYPVFLNVNSVTSSPTMCARRLFELSAAQTAVLSAPSAAIEPFFGDTVTVVRDRDEADAALGVLLDQPEHRDRLALRAHRRVFDQHLYGHRVDTVLAAVGLSVPARGVSISAVVPTMRPGNIELVLAQLGAQTHGDLELVLVTHGFEVDPQDLARRARDAGVAHTTIRHASAHLTLGACMNMGVDAASGHYVAKMDDDNTYTPHYLSDLVRAFSYADAEVVGKWAHYVHLAASNAIVLRFAQAEHRYTDLVQGGTILTPREVARTVRFEDLPRRVDTTFLGKVRAQGGGVYSADRFNYVSRRGASPEAHTWGIADVDLLNRGSRIVGYGDGIDHVSV
ncbi:MAG: glycosyltransferase [Ornithinimicrobium sp.]